MQARTRGFVFTLNNFTEQDTNYLDSEKIRKQTKYLIYGKEQGEEKKTPHLQGFIYFINAKTFSQVKKLLGDRYHIENARGSIKENIAYCSKDDEYVEHGEVPEQGTRSDIKQIKELVKSHATMKEIIEQATSYQAIKTAEVLMKYQGPRERQPPEIKWFWGKSGAGKTRAAWEELGYEDTWISSDTLRWWDGYNGQKNVIIDEFRGDFCKFHTLLRIIDRYPFRVENKGGSMWLNADKIIITSCYRPQDVYETIENKTQLIRRLEEVRYFE